MSLHVLENEFLKVSVDELGAELVSVRNKETGKEYMWNADPEYWRRHAPILFPFVGSLKNKIYRYHNKEYMMGQHGFARDMQFALEEQMKENELNFTLVSNEETLKVYPFSFQLVIGYQLNGRQIKISWKVINTSGNIMLFQIGAHPAFFCPLYEEEKKDNYFLAFEDTKELNVNTLDMQSGLAAEHVYQIPLLVEADHLGYLPLNESLFENDALILENKQCKKIKLCRPDKTPYVTVTFDMPLVGIWSPARKNAPFVCIEPWFGRCDSVHSNGELEDKEYMNQLEGHETFQTSYDLLFE